MTGQEITISGIGIGVFLSILLSMIYSTWNIENRWKPWIAVIIGMAISVLALFTIPDKYTSKIVIAYLAQGFMTGATATGVYELTKKRG